MRYSFHCHECGARFKIQHTLDESYYEVNFCAFCSSEIAEYDEDKEKDEYDDEDDIDEY